MAWLECLNAAGVRIGDLEGAVSFPNPLDHLGEITAEIPRYMLGRDGESRDQSALVAANIVATLPQGSQGW